MNVGDRVTLPDGRSGIIWRIADGYAWVNLDGHHFKVEKCEERNVFLKWAAVEAVVKVDDLSRQLRLPLEET